MSGIRMVVPKSLKIERAIECATDVFTRYGYARTTMGDIAARAEMSRPALYLLFPDKDSIFDHVVRRMDERKLAEIGDTLAKLDDPSEKLLRACLDWGLHGVELAAAHPDAADLFDLRFPAVRQVYANFEALVAGLIEVQVTRSGIDASPTELARALIYGMRGLRDVPRGETDMRRLIAVQVRTLLRAIDVSGERQLHG